MNTSLVRDCISFGWETFKKRPWFFIGVLVVVMVVNAVASGIVPEHSGFTLGLAGFLFSMAVSTFAKMGTLTVLLKAHESVESVQFNDLWAPEQFWKFLIASIVVGIMVVIGFILLIIPGIYLVLRFMFVQYLVIDRKLELGEALKESTRITDGHKWHLLVLMLGIIGINILGILALGVGLLVSVPVSMLAVAHAYRTLEHKASEVAAA